MKTVKVRKARREDCAAIIELKKELALHQNVSHVPHLSAQDLERDGFDAQPPFFHCLVAEETLEASQEKVILGYGLYYNAYPVWEGQGLYLEDLCVSAKHRGKGVGTLILGELAKIAMEGNFSRITLDCKNSNRSGMDFYDKHFGVDLTLTEGWNLWRLDRDAISNLANRVDYKES